jgi:hypothetical protein
LVDVVSVGIETTRSRPLKAIAVWDMLRTTASVMGIGPLMESTTNLEDQARLARWLRDFCVFGCALLCSVVPNATRATRSFLRKSKLNFHGVSYEPGGSEVRISPGAPYSHGLSTAYRRGPLCVYFELPTDNQDNSTIPRAAATARQPVPRRSARAWTKDLASWCPN